MDNKDQPIGLLNACIQFFGLRTGQSRMDFMKDEYKKLTAQDRDEIRDALKAQGWNIADAVGPATA